jgi:peptidoglycan/LPS O-acetylase OafA/YrhL
MLLNDGLFDRQSNNFTLVRFALASMVIYTHAYWFTHGVSGTDDLSGVLGVPVSAYAVEGFFFLSGFLVYPSLLRLGSIPAFLAVRLARLWPALALCVLVTVLGGLFVTVAPPAGYFGGETAQFLVGNLSLLRGGYFLTGVDCGTGPCNVNGSLWTLPWEARFYALLAILGATGLARPAILARVILPTGLVLALAWDFAAVQGWGLELLGEGPMYILGTIDRLGFMFGLGIAAYVFRDRIRLSWLALGFLFLAVLAASQLGLSPHVRGLFIGYALLCFGFLTARKRAMSGNWPDYSYGMYLYAFPVMWVVSWALATESHLLLGVATWLATLPVAALSWHLVEKPALDLVRGSKGEAVPQPLLQP